MARYEMKDLGYPEYVKFCEAEDIAPVSLDEYCKLDFLHEFLTTHKIPNAIWDSNGLTWAEHVNFFGSTESNELKRP